MIFGESVPHWSGLSVVGVGDGSVGAPSHELMVGRKRVAEKFWISLGEVGFGIGSCDFSPCMAAITLRRFNFMSL